MEPYTHLHAIRANPDVIQIGDIFHILMELMIDRKWKPSEKASKLEEQYHYMHNYQTRPQYAFAERNWLVDAILFKYGINTATERGHDPIKGKVTYWPPEIQPAKAAPSPPSRPETPAKMIKVIDHKTELLEFSDRISPIVKEKALTFTGQTPLPIPGNWVSLDQLYKYYEAALKTRGVIDIPNQDRLDYLDVFYYLGKLIEKKKWTPTKNAQNLEKKYQYIKKSKDKLDVKTRPYLQELLKKHNLQ